LADTIDISGGITDKLNQVLETSENWKKSLSDIADSFKTIAISLGGVQEKFNATNKALETAGDAFSRVLEGIQTGGAKFMGENPIVRALTQIAGAALPATKSMTTLGEAASKSTGSLTASSEVISKLSAKIPGLGGVLGTLGTGWIKQWEAVRDAENGLRRMLATSGDLYKVFNEGISVASQLSVTLNDYQEHVYRVAQRTGETTSQVSKYYTELGKITGAYQAVIANTPAGDISLMEAALRVAKGTGQDFSAVFKVMNDQFRRFNQVGEKPLSLFAQMHDTSQALGIRLEYVTGNVEKISQSFRNYGDTTEGALKLTEGFYSAFKDVEGLGPETIGKLIQGVSDSISSLNIAQKAFLSQQTGGAGGLRGAYEIELKLQKGGVDEVYRLMEESLKKQFGGKITTREEASQSDTAAAELTRQVAFLREGPFGKMVENDAAAYRLLEAFKAGTAPEEKQKDAFGDALAESEGIQRRHTTILTGIENKVGRMSELAGKGSVEFGRRFVGVGGGVGRAGSGEAEGVFSSTQKKLEAQAKTGTVVPGEVGTRTWTLDDVAKEFGQQAVDSFSLVTGSIKDAMSEMLPTLADVWNIDGKRLTAVYEKFVKKLAETEGKDKKGAVKSDTEKAIKSDTEKAMSFQAHVLAALREGEKGKFTLYGEKPVPTAPVEDTRRQALQAAREEVRTVPRTPVSEVGQEQAATQKVRKQNEIVVHSIIDVKVEPGQTFHERFEKTDSDGLPGESNPATAASPPAATANVVPKPGPVDIGY